MKIEDRQTKTSRVYDIAIGRVFRLISTQESKKECVLTEGHFFLNLWEGVVDLNTNIFYDDDKVDYRNLIGLPVNAKLVIED